MLKKAAYENVVRFAQARGEELVVQLRADGVKFLTVPDFSKTEVLIQSGRFARLVCVPAALRAKHHVGCEVLTQATQDAVGLVFVAKGGVCIFLSDLSVGQFVKVLPQEPEDGPAVRVFLPRPMPELSGAVAVQLTVA